GTISGNSSSSAGGGVFCRNTGIFRITNGIVYGNTAEPAELRNTAYSGAALQSESDTAQHGTFNTEGEWQSAGDLTTTDDTIEVIDGVLQN
ncbi:MAG: hypothetical protein FWH38_04620, partial [Treponema sp.]|nr:hypothetical protein [Treponema sp.]